MAKYTIDVPESSILNGELTIPLKIFGKSKLLKTGIHIEEKQEEQINFEIGDEVIANDDMEYFVGSFYEPFVITGILSGNVVGFGKEFKCHSMGINDVVKTVRHFTKKEINVLKEYLEVDENDWCK